MSEREEIERITAKIKKIQLLAQRGGTPEEAAAAAAKVQELLAKHSISMTQIAIENGEELTGYGHMPIEIGASSWRAVLIGACATSCLCRAIYLTTKSKKRVDIVGHRDNVSGTIDLFHWLCGTIERMSWTAWRALDRETRINEPRPTAWRIAYKQGAATTVARRLREQRASEDSNANDQKTLIVIDTKVEEVFNKLYPNTQSAGITRSFNYSAGFHAGVRDGERMALQRRQGIAATSTKRIEE